MRDLYRSMTAPTSSGFVAGNRVTLLHDGHDFFPAIEAAFGSARHEIHVQTYILADDATGRRVAHALECAASRGVKVHLLIDGYGSKDLPPRVLEQLRAGGVETQVFGRSISPWTLRRERLRRMHRKIVVVDRAIAFVGGINLRDDHAGGCSLTPRYDFAVSVEGPLVDTIRLAARRLWAMLEWRTLGRGSLRREELPPPNPCSGSMSGAFVLRDNFRHRRDIERAYLDSIARARSEVILSNAYFLPGIDFRHALVDAAGRGVRVVLLLQGRREHFLQHHATRALYGSLLDAGVEIHEYGRGFLHAKVAVVDGRWATVGSSNIDPFSLLLAWEANVMVDDKGFGAMLRNSLARTLTADAREILPRNWKRTPIAMRLLGWVCYGLLRLSMAISGYARDPRPPRAG